MSNYAQTTFFAPKDLLAPGNPAKVIFGAQIDPELAAISVAIATKYDAALIASGQILFGAGNAGAPSISFTGGTNSNTGLYLAAANSLGFAVNGAAVGSIASSGAWTIGSSAVAQNVAALNIAGNSTAGQSKGLFINAGTNSSDTALLVQNQAATVTFLQLFGDGHGNLGPNATNTLSWNTSGAFVVAAPTAGNALKVNGIANQYAALIQGVAGAGTSLGLLIQAGTNASDAGLAVTDPTGATVYFEVFGNAAIKARGSVAAALVDMSPDASTFTGTLTGVSSGSGTCVWARNGNHVTLFFPAMTGTSNSTSFTMTGLPAAIQPARTQTVQIPDGVMFDNGTIQNSGIAAQFTAASGTVTFLKGSGSGNWTAASTKGFNIGCTVSYLLN